MKKLQKNSVEWVCFGLSLLLIGGVIVFLVQDALVTGEAPARIQFQLSPPQLQEDGRFQIKVTAENRGDRTAQSVQVEVMLESAGQEERAGFLIDLLPRHGKREGYVTFAADPGKASRLQARALGYAEP